jgi:hypothetical protein
MNVNNGDYFMKYDSVAYASTIGNNVYGGGWWYAADKSVEYATGVAGAEGGDALKVTLTYSSNGTAGISLNLIAPLTGGGYSQIRVKGDFVAKVPSSQGNSDALYDAAYYSVSEPDENGWVTINVPGWCNWVRTFDFIGGGTAGSTTEFYIDYVK